MSIHLHQLFTDNMVLAANRPIRVFGEASEDVTVTMGDNSVTVNCENGKWLAELPAMEYGGPFNMTINSGNDVITLSNIFIGEVIIIGGQSNMQLKVLESETEKDKVVKNENLRFFMLERPEKTQGAENIFPEDGWVMQTDDNIGWWSLLGTRIAEFVAKEKQCTVGLIGCYQGASTVESWLPAELCDAPEYLVPIEKKNPYNHTSEQCLAWNTNGFLYNYMWSKILPFSVNSLVWYQGEADASYDEALVYDLEMKALIKRYREDLLYHEMPFVVIQIANLDDRKDYSGWLELQEAQLRLNAPEDKVYVVISKDVCESDTIHPPTKIHIAKRVADILNS